MLNQQSARSLSLPLELALERQIRQRTWGRVAQLDVERLGDRVIVRGYTSSYYVKQLAIQAALDSLGSAEFPRLEVEIEVGPSAVPVVAGHNRDYAQR